MDTEDGVEVVWNEVRYSNRKAVSTSKVRWWVCEWVRGCVCEWVSTFSTVSANISIMYIMFYFR